MTNTDRILKAVGIVSIGALLGKMFNNYVIPLCEMRMTEVQNDLSIATAELQSKLIDIQEGNQSVQSSVIGFQTDDYEEEYED